MSDKLLDITMPCLRNSIEWVLDSLQDYGEHEMASGDPGEAFLGQIYASVAEQLPKLLDEVATLREENANLRNRRAAICTHCGHAEHYGENPTPESVKATVLAMMEHDRTCDKNPLVKGFKALREERDALAFYAECLEARWTLFRDNYGNCDAVQEWHDAMSCVVDMLFALPAEARKALGVGRG